MNTRTVRARLVFPNPALLLKPGMFVNVELKAPAGMKLTIPASSIFQSGNRKSTFSSIRARATLSHAKNELSPRFAMIFVVLNGLKPGESHRHFCQLPDRF